MGPLGPLSSGLATHWKLKNGLRPTRQYPVKWKLLCLYIILQQEPIEPLPSNICRVTRDLNSSYSVIVRARVVLKRTSECESRGVNCARNNFRKSKSYPFSLSQLPSPPFLLVACFHPQTELLAISELN